MAHQPTSHPSRVRRFALVALLCGAAVLGAPEAAQAQLTTPTYPTPRQGTPSAVVSADSPDGGTRITNQAVVSYLDSTDRERSVTTNEVTLVVEKVFAGYLALDGQVAAAPPNGEAQFRHTLTNTGNAPLNFCLSARKAGVDSGMEIAHLRVYRDLNDNGRLDATDALLFDGAQSATPGMVHLERDESMGLLLAASTRHFNPTAQAVAQTFAEIVAKIAPDMSCVDDKVSTNGNVLDVNQVRILSAPGASIETVKTSTYHQNGPGVADDTISYSVTVKNVGTQTAWNVKLWDEMLKYQTLTLGSVAISPPSGSYLVSETPSLFSVEFGAMAPDQELTVVYQANLSPGAIVGDYANNIARVDYTMFSASGTPVTVYSNQTIDPIPPDLALTLRDTNDADDHDGLLNDVQTLNSANEGAEVLFHLIATNQSSIAKAMQIFVNPEDPTHLAIPGFPNGSIFDLRHADGFTRLGEASGGWHELGMFEPGASRRFVVAVRLPVNAPTDAPYRALATLRFLSDPALTDTAALLLNASVPARVDIAVTAGPGFNDGGLENQDPASIAAVALTGMPGQKLEQQIIIANEGGVEEDYLLDVWMDPAMTIPALDGWKAHLTRLSGEAEALTRTGLIAPNAAGSLFLNLTVPATAPGPYSLYVSARGGVSGVTDAVRIDVNAAEIATPLALSPDRSATIPACGVASYTHRLENLGFETLMVSLRLQSQSAFSSAIDFPVGPAGQEPTEFQPMQDLPNQFLTIGASYAVYEAASGGWVARSLYWNGVAVPLTLELRPGDWTLVRLRVFAPCSAPEGATDVAVLVAEAKSGLHQAFVTDRTSVARILLGVEKAGALDEACDGAPDSDFVMGGVSAPPGGCVIWRLTTSNLGAEPVCDVRLDDDAPDFTILQGMPFIVAEPPPGGGSCSASGDAISCLVGPPIDINGDGTAETHCLRPGESAEARFTVRIQ